MKPLYIFDLDGTLALCSHRLHLLDNKDDPQRWRKFYAACDKDLPNEPVIRTMERLHQAGADIRIFTGRSDEVRPQTVTWLAKHTSFMSWALDSALTMRAEGDYAPDHELKSGWLDALSAFDRMRIVAVFDDRDSVVRMWRERGVACFQVAPGEF